MVVGSLQVALYQMSVDRRSRCCGYYTILVIRIVIVECRFYQHFCQCIIRLVVALLWCIYQQVRRLVVIVEAQQAFVVIE